EDALYPQVRSHGLAKQDRARQQLGERPGRLAGTALQFRGLADCLGSARRDDAEGAVVRDRSLHAIQSDHGSRPRVSKSDGTLRLVGGGIIGNLVANRLGRYSIAFVQPVLEIGQLATGRAKWARTMVIRYLQHSGAHGALSLHQGQSSM